MQAASDLFLGWTYGRGGRHFYIRQLHDVKVKPMVEVYDAPTMTPMRLIAAGSWRARMLAVEIQS